MGSQFLPDFLSNALATLPGALLGIPIALGIDRRQSRETARSSAHKMLTLLRAQLQHNIDQFEQWQSSPDRLPPTALLRGFLKDELWCAFSDGGGLSSLKDVELLASLADSYHSVRVTRDLATSHFESVQFLASGNSPAIGQDLLVRLSTHVSQAKQRINTTIQAADKYLGTLKGA